MGNVHSTDDFTSLAHTVKVDNSDDVSAARPRETCVYHSASHPEGLVDNMIDGDMNVAYDCFRRGMRIANNGEGGYLGVRRRANCNNELLGVCSEDGELLAEYSYLTYRQIESYVHLLGTVLLNSNLIREAEYPEEEYERGRKMKVLCISSRNRAEWFITDLACQLYGFTSCPLYETFSESSIAYILKQTKSSIIAGSVSNLKYILDVLDYTARAEADNSKPLDNIPGEAGMPPPIDHSIRKDSVETFLSYDNHVPLDIQERASAYGIKILTWKQIIDQGKTLPLYIPEKDPHPHDVCSICYTSGTTGIPKGVMITQKAFAANISAALRGPCHGQGLDLNPDDIYMSYLPLAHVLERVLCSITTSIGAKLAIYSGDTRTLLEDIKVAEPTVFASVPRLFMRINDRIQTGLNNNSAVVRYLFSKGMESKIKRLREAGEVCHPFWDKLIFKRIKSLLGSRLRYMISGGAALEKEIQEKMACLFSCRLLEGYGLTETLGATFIRRGADAVYGHIGMPLPCVEVKLVEVPEMGYYVCEKDKEQDQGLDAIENVKATDCPEASDGPFNPMGELLVRGYTVTPGYFLNPEGTKEAFIEDDEMRSADGRTYKWFKTGDVAVILAGQGGRVKIIDRRKNLFKMSQGEYIAPERIENIYSQIPMVSQIFVYGDSSRVYLVAIVVLDPEEVYNWADETSVLKELSIKSASRQLAEHEMERVLKVPKLKAHVLAEMDRVAQVAGLKGFEKVKNIMFSPEPFTAENGILTPTFKLKRNVATQKFRNEISTLYNESF